MGKSTQFWSFGLVGTPFSCVRESRAGWHALQRPGHCQTNSRTHRSGLPPLSIGGTSSAVQNSLHPNSSTAPARKHTTNVSPTGNWCRNQCMMRRTSAPRRRTTDCAYELCALCRQALGTGCNSEHRTIAHGQVWEIKIVQHPRQSVQSDQVQTACCSRCPQPSELGVRARTRDERGRWNLDLSLWKVRSPVNRCLSCRRIDRTVQRLVNDSRSLMQRLSGPPTLPSLLQ